jgi:cbb3-type cytochrome oxidase subunit 3
MTMLTAGTNALAMARFGFRIAHGGGEAFGLLVITVSALGILVWALSQSGRNESAKN